MRLRGALACAVVALLVSAAPAAGSSSVAVTPTATTPGSTVTISGTVPVSGDASCAPGDAAQLTSTAALFPPDGFGPQAVRDANGAFSVSYAVPATTPPGSYTIGVRCGDGNTGVGASLQVTAAAASTSTSASTTTAPPARKKTTSRSGWVAVSVAAIVLVLGLAAVVARRRRLGATAPRRQP